MTVSNRFPQLELEKGKDQFIIKLHGSWQGRFLGEKSLALSQKFLQKKYSSLVIKVDKDFSLDTCGAVWLHQHFKKLKKQGTSYTVEGITQSQQDLLNQAEEILNQELPASEGKTVFSIKNFLNGLGLKTIKRLNNIHDLVTFLGEILVTWRTIKRQSLRWVSVYHHIDAVGVQALPIIGLISFLIGAVLAYQGINQLSRFGAQIYAVDFLGVAILREISVLLTSIVVAGRSGSSFTAQIGTMALNQEVDAIRIFKLNPIMVLVLPRLLALLIALPLLVFFSMIMGMIGGMTVTKLVIGMPAVQFWQQFLKAVAPSYFWVGMSKAPLFALLIAIVGCYRGFKVHGSSQSVGEQTTRSVVEAIFLVIIFDALMSILFSFLKI